MCKYRERALQSRLCLKRQNIIFWLCLQNENNKFEYHCLAGLCSGNQPLLSTPPWQINEHLLPGTFTENSRQRWLCIWVHVQQALSSWEASGLLQFHTAWPSLLLQGVFFCPTTRTTYSAQLVSDVQPLYIKRTEYNTASPSS